MLEKIIGEFPSSKDLDVNRLCKELKTNTKKVETVLKGSTNRLIAAITDDLELTSDKFNSSSVFEPSMTEDIITPMNTGSAPQGEMDVFKVIRNSNERGSRKIYEHRLHISESPNWVWTTKITSG